MKILNFGKDGGEESTVFGFFMLEIKSLFSIVFLRFEGRSREAYHSHAFNCLSWVVSGSLREQHLDGSVEIHKPSVFPILTRRSTFHKVDSDGTTKVISIRGPWSKTWEEFIPGFGLKRLSNGRKEVSL